MERTFWRHRTKYPTEKKDHKGGGNRYHLSTKGGAGRGSERRGNQSELKIVKGALKKIAAMRGRWLEKYRALVGNQIDFIVTQPKSSYPSLVINKCWYQEGFYSLKK